MIDSSAPLNLFISYCHADNSYLIELDKHLSALKRENLIAPWFDRKIVPGQNWESKINSAIQDADIIVFLLTPDFFNSEYCMGKEVAVALDKHERGQAIVLPVLVRPVDWLSSPISKLQALPPEGKPVSIWGDRDEAWLEVIMGFRTAITDLRMRRAVTHRQLLFTPIRQALNQELERMEDRLNGEPLKAVGGLSTGLVDLDTAIDGIHPGDLIFVASAPVMDRLSLLLSIARHVLVEKSLPGLIFSLRQSKEKIARRLCANVGHISAHSLLRGMLTEDDWAHLQVAVSKMCDQAIGIVDTPYMDIDTVISQIDHFKKQYGSCALVLIDAIEHVMHITKQDMLSTLSRYARANDIAIIIGGGLERDPSPRIDKRPILRDIGEWAMLNEDIDFVIFVYQDEQYNPDTPDLGTAELLIAKNARGSISDIRLTYLRKQQIFETFTGYNF